MFTKLFWFATTERAVKTFAQVLLGFLTVGAIGITHLPWNEMVSVAATATVASVLTSIVSGAKDGNPSITSIETTAPTAPPVTNIVQHFTSPVPADSQLPLPLNERLPVLSSDPVAPPVDPSAGPKHLA